jgi:hypothetical protein
MSLIVRGLPRKGTRGAPYLHGGSSGYQTFMGSTAQTEQLLPRVRLPARNSMYSFPRTLLPGRCWQ